jgi:hypothetical protein
MEIDSEKVQEKNLPNENFDENNGSAMEQLIAPQSQQKIDNNSIE